MARFSRKYVVYSAALLQDANATNAMIILRPNSLIKGHMLIQLGIY